MWDDLRREFVNMDPYNTGCVNKDEFKDVLGELCIHLSNWELEHLCERFDTKKDGRWVDVMWYSPT